MDFLNSFDSKTLYAVLIFILYVLLAKAVDIFINRILKRLVKFTKSELDDKLIDMAHRPVFLTVIIIGTIHAINILKPSGDFTFYSHGVLYTLSAFIWGIFILRISNMIINDHLHKAADITGLSKEVTPLIENVWKVIVILGGIMVVLSIWEVDITPLLASAGIVGVAVAFAAKDTIANFFGGISIFLDKPYKIGDYIVLDRGERGEVFEIGIRSTRIKTRDDILISVPNAIIANSKIINESAPVPNFRVRTPVSVAYGSDIEKVEKILLDVALDNENILKTPEPRVRLREFAESSLNFELLCWAREPSLRGRTTHELNKAVYNKFNEAGITIPFPQRTVYVRKEKNWQDE